MYHILYQSHVPFMGHSHSILLSYILFSKKVVRNHHTDLLLNYANHWHWNVDLVKIPADIYHQRDHCDCLDHDYGKIIGSKEKRNASCSFLDCICDRFNPGYSPWIQSDPILSVLTVEDLGLFNL